MKHFLYILPFAAALTFAGCGEKDKTAQLEDLKKQHSEIKQKIAALEAEMAKSGEGKKDGGRDVAVTKIEPAVFRHLIEVQARVEGDENVTVSPETMGTVSRVLVKVGDKVNAGSVLAELESNVYLRSLEELQSAREFASTLFQKQKSLWDQKIGTEIQYLQAKNNLESIDKKIATVRQQLEMTRIKSPIHGTVDAVDIKVGQAFAPGMPGLRVVNFARLKVQAEVAEAYIAKVKKGDPVEVYFPDQGNSVNAVISYAGKVIDPLNRTFRVEMDMSGKEASLHPNQVAVVRITDYKSDQAIALPLAIVQTTPEGSYVFLADGNKAKKQAVTPGLNYAGKLEIKDGLKPGDMVVTSGYQDLIDGQPIKFQAAN
ncbi:MAG: efflux RND transporter periplasmic adaptor subunit [Bacteroidia bacterium]|nr:efflux RND transporter periplasmic adaptor subunit [Bacteroidia bacterium]